jgi:hypothetical protein
LRQYLCSLIDLVTLYYNIVILQLAILNVFVNIWENSNPLFKKFTKILKN